MSVRFDAATDKISYTGGGVPDPASGITFVAWVYNAVDLNTNATYARLWTGGSTTATFATSVDGTGGPNYFTGGGTVTATTGTPVAAWRPVAFTVTGTATKVYATIPGGSTEVVSGTASGAASPTSITLGGRSTTDDSEWWNGRVAYARVWSAVLSQAQIEAEWAATAPVRTSGLWADWPLETAGDLTDHSGNGRHLTAGGTAVTTEAGPPLAESHSGSVTLTATAAVSVAGRKNAAGSVTLSASAAVAVNGQKAATGAASVAANGTVTAVGSKSAAGSTALGAVAAIVAAGAKAVSAVRSLAASAGLALSGSSHRSGSVTLRATASLVAERQGALPPNLTYTATLAPQPGPAVVLEPQRWTVTLEAQ